MSLLNASTAVKELDFLDRKRAETLFALAILNAKHGYRRVAKGYAEECILLLHCIGTDTYEECATSGICCQGVVLPEFLHEDVVRVWLKPFQVQV